MSVTVGLTLDPYPLFPRLPCPPTAALPFITILMAQIGFFDDKVGPITVAGLVLLTLLTIFTVALIDYLF